MRLHGAFYGRETTLLQGNLFKIYAVGDSFHFARVADKSYEQVLDSGAVSGLTFGLGGLAMKHGVMQPALRKQKEMEARVEAVEPGGTEFLAADKRNFSVRSGEILGAELKKTPALMRGGDHLGILELSLSNGQKRRFMLSGKVSPQEAEQIIRQVASGAQGSL